MWDFQWKNVAINEHMIGLIGITEIFLILACT
jgi:hypothetical protein